MPTCTPACIADGRVGHGFYSTIDMLSRRSGQVFNRVNHCQSVHTSVQRKLNINNETPTLRQHVEQLRETTTAGIEPYLLARPTVPLTWPTEAVATAIAAGNASARCKVPAQRHAHEGSGFFALETDATRRRSRTTAADDDATRAGSVAEVMCSLRRHGRACTNCLLSWPELLLTVCGAGWNGSYCTGTVPRGTLKTARAPGTRAYYIRKKVTRPEPQPIFILYAKHAKHPSFLM